MRKFNIFSRNVRTSLPARGYFTIEGLEDDGVEGISTIAADLPRALKVKGRFVSTICGGSKKSFSDVLNWLLTSKQTRLSLPSNKYHDKESIVEVAADYVKIQDRRLTKLSWVGHSTMFCTVNGVNILTDPIWSDYASPLQFMGPKRYIKPALDLNKLDIDIVLLSHTHYDHLDYNTATKIGNRAKWIVPLGAMEVLRNFGISNCVELDWWASHQVMETAKSGSVDITFTPTKHWTSRNPFDRNTSLWGSFVVKSNTSSFFFGGDTAYHDVFKIIGAKYGPFDFAALPIGAYKPRWFMKDNHVNPEEAVMIHTDIRSKQTAAIHWGTFPLSDEDYVEPALELARVREILGVPVRDFFSLQHGDTWILGDEPKSDFAMLRPKMFQEYQEYYYSSNRTTKSVV